MKYTDYKARLDRVFETYGDRVFCRYRYESGVMGNRTYADIRKIALDCERFLQAHGVRHGDRAAILCTDVYQSFVTFAALTYCGMTALLLDATMPPAQRNELLAFGDVRAVFTTAGIAQSMGEVLQNSLPVCAVFGEEPVGTVLNGWEGEFPPAVVPPTPDTLLILFSSGTTARAKGVEISYTGPENLATIAPAYFGMKKGESIFTPVPLCHMAGILPCYAAFVNGVTLYAAENFIISRFVPLLREFQPTVLTMVPHVFDLMIAKTDEETAHSPVKKTAYRAADRMAGFLRRNLHAMGLCRILTAPFRASMFGGKMRYVLTGSASASPATVEKMLNMGMYYCNLYGSTEMCPAITGTTDRDICKTDSVGKVSRFEKHGSYVRIFNPDENGEGEIQVNSVQRMNGYFRDPELTAASYDGEWFRTGDKGYLDRDGYLHVTGRFKESIHLESGKRVTPADLDALLRPAVPLTVLYAAAGVPDEKTGFDRIYLFLERGTLDTEEQERLRGKILAFGHRELPTYPLDGIRFVEKIPTTSIGKIRRRELAASVRQDAQTAEQNGTEQTGAARNTVPDESMAQRVRDAICAAAGLAKEFDTAALLREELGVDSLTMMRIVSAVDAEFHTLIGPYVRKIRTADDIIAFLKDPAPFADGAEQSGKFDVNRFPRRRGVFRTLCFRILSRVLSHAAGLTADGVENIPAGQFILCPNHESHFDGVWVYEALGKRRMPPSRLACMAKEEHWDSFVSRSLAQLAGGIPVSRGGNVTPAYQRSAEFLHDGGYLLIHPEGTRTRDGKLGTFHLGAAALSCRTGVPIVPVTVTGAYALFPAGSRRFTFRDAHGGKNRVHVHFGAPIDPSGKNPTQITALCRADIEAHRGDRNRAE